MNHQSYPKRVWVLTQAEVILEGQHEVVSHEHDQVIGATFDALVAEKMAGVLKDNQSIMTLIKSDINPLPTAIVDAIQETSDTSVDALLEMIDLER